MDDLAWVKEARRWIGQREIKGAKHNPNILAWLKRMGGFNGEHKAWWADDENAWCGLFVGYCLGVSERFVIPAWYRAKAWGEHPAMTKLDKPAYGCLAVFNRTGGGHVGFVVGQDGAGNILVLGGNQGDAVNIRSFPKTRVSSYVWPAKWDGKAIASHPLKQRFLLAAGSAPISNNEA